MKFCFAIFLTLCIFTCYGQITQVNNMEEVLSYFKEADQKTLAIFDVDMVLVQPSEPAFQMANMKRFGTISKRILKEIPAEKQMIFLSLMTLGSDPILIDQCTPKLLQEIAQKGIPAMALTANLTGEFSTIKNMQEWRVKGLRRMGIDFSVGAPYQSEIIFNELAPYRGNYSTYLDGILFVNGTGISKGDALLAFLEKTTFSPNKIVFIDDREDNLKSVEEAVQKLDRHFEFVGLHFLGAQKYPSTLISEKEFEDRWLELAYESKQLN